MIPETRAIGILYADNPLIFMTFGADLRGGSVDVTQLSFILRSLLYPIILSTSSAPRSSTSEDGYIKPISKPDVSHCYDASHCHDASLKYDASQTQVRRLSRTLSVLGASADVSQIL